VAWNTAMKIDDQHGNYQIQVGRTIVLVVLAGVSIVALHFIVRYADGWHALTFWTISTLIGCVAAWKAPAEEKDVSHFWSIVAGVTMMLLVFFSSAFSD
jgi:hypothetical protein